MSLPDEIDISSLSAVYASGSATPTTIVRALHARVLEYSHSNPHVWIDVVPLEDLLRRAQQVEAAYVGRDKPRLYGVPFSVKNNIDIGTYRTTAGCEAFTYYPEASAPVVQRCLEAGAILLGTTNMEQFATGLTGCRSPYGTPLCHLDHSYCAGGSSSGSAVSVSARLVTFSIGTDTAGSIRVPAALNGVVGFKPTYGTVSKRGVVPAVKTLDCVGTLTRTVRDAQTVWDVIKGYDELDLYSRRIETICQPARWGMSKVLRFGVPPPNLLARLSTEYIQSWTKTMEEVTARGLQQSSAFDYGAFEDANGMVYGSSLVAQRLSSFDEFLAKHGTSSLHPAIRTIFETTPQYTAIDVFKDLDRVAELRRRAELEFRDKIDVLIVPSTAKHSRISEVEADPFGTNKTLGSFSQFVNVLDLCAISIPVDRWSSQGGHKMSFGITLIAEAGMDAELLELAGKLALR